MKKRIILLPIMMLALAACQKGGESVEPASTEPASVEEVSTTPAPTSTEPTSTAPTSTEPASTEPEFVLPTDLEHAGTEEDPFSVADARKVAEATGETATKDSYYISGVVQSVNTSGVASYGNININMVDEGGTDVFQAFQIYGLNGEKFTADTAAEVVVGAKVVVVGPIVNYKGNTPETTGKGTAHMVSIDATEVPEFVLPTDLEHAGTQEDPFSVADALKVAEVAGGTVTADAYYVRGEIKSVGTLNTQYGNVDVVIKDAEVDNEFTLYRLKDVGGEKFTAETVAKLAVGEELVAVGNIKTHTHTSGGTTPEMDQGCALVSVTETEHVPVPVESIDVAEAELTVEVGKSVALGAKVLPENADDQELVYEVEQEGIVEINNGKAKGLAEGTVVVTVKAHEDETITATITITVVAAEEPEEPGEVLSATYTFEGALAASKTSAAALDSSEAVLGIFKTESDLMPVSASNITKVYAGANGGSGASAYVNHDVLKIGTGSAVGSLDLTFNEDVKIEKVTVKCAGWYAESELVVNGTTKSSGVKMTSAYESADVEYELEEATNVLSFATTTTGKPSTVIFQLVIEYTK